MRRIPARAAVMAMALSGLCGLDAAEVTADWQIAVPEARGAVTDILRMAAEELQADIEEAMGFRLPIVGSAKSRSPAFRFGEDAARQAGFSLDDFVRWDNAYAERGGDVYFFGVDRAFRSGNVGEWHNLTFPSYRACARFLKDRLGVRFLMPGRVGTDVPRLGRADIPGGTLSVERPTQDYGSASGEKGYISFAMGSGWLPPGVYFGYGGHSYARACPASLGKEHPEYFGLFGGRRVVPKGEGPLCISNPAVQQLMVDELVRRFDAGAEVCQLGQQDGFRGCECEECRAYGGEAAKGDWGEKLWILHADIARRVAKVRPGKVVRILSYGPTVHPPKSFRVFPGNVMVEKCSYTEESFREWDGYTVPHGFIAYVYLWGDYPGPGFTAKLSIADAAAIPRMLLRNGVHGVYRCGYGELYGTEGPAYYVFNSVLMDPKADERALFVEYCSRAYGPAAAAMMRFHEIQDARLALFSRKYPPQMLDYFACAYAPHVLRDMGKALSRAESTAGLSAKQSKRLELVRLEFDYLRAIADIATLHAAYQTCPTDAVFAPLADAIRGRKAFIDGLYAGGRNIRKLDGWPELKPFGSTQGVSGSFPKSLLMTNGRLRAKLGSPLGWDVDFLQKSGILPGTSVKRAKVPRLRSAPSAEDFESGQWSGVPWNDMGGIQMQKIEKSARFKVAYDDEALYVAVESDIDSAATRGFGHDGSVWLEASCDLVVDPTGSRDICYHVIWNPAEGSFLDEAYGLVQDPLDPLFGSFDLAWNGKGWKFANRRSGDRWFSMLTIPFSMLGRGKPNPGEMWCFNLGREWNGWTGDPSKFVDALWSPDVETGSFKSLAAMGELTFE